MDIIQRIKQYPNSEQQDLLTALLHLGEERLLELFNQAEQTGKRIAVQQVPEGENVLSDSVEGFLVDRK